MGAYGRECDRNVYNSSKIKRLLRNNSLGLPEDCELPDIHDGSYPEMPHVFVADDAFPLTSQMMKPYVGRATGLMSRFQRVFNYR